jgi:hypothetical protein
MTGVPMDFETCFERLVSWAMAYAAECDEDYDTDVVAQVNRDAGFMRHEIDWAGAMADVVASGGLPEAGRRPVRLDLALGACQVAAKADQLDVVQAFAQTAIAQSNRLAELILTPPQEREGT